MKNYLIAFCLVLSSACLFSQTLIPDANFEQALLNQNIDSDGILNGQVPTSDINSLSILDVNNSNIADLTGIEDFENLIVLNCSNNNLTSLDFSNQPELEDIDCSHNLLTSLTLYPTSTGTNYADIRLYCNNNLLTSLDLNGLYLLNILDCSFNNIQNLSINTLSLTQLDVNNNNLTELDFTTNSSESFIDFDFNTKSNPNLLCIAVNDPVYCTANYASNKDSQTVYATDCANLGITELESYSFNIYPNPTKTKFTIQLKNTTELKKVTIYNNLGQHVLTSKKLVINTSKLVSGLYFLEIETNKGKGSKKLIIE